MVNTSSGDSVPEVAITGVGGCFPQSANIEELKQKLIDQVDMIETARWKEGQLDICSRTGNIPHIDNFDAFHFGIHRKQARYMDPQARILLEKTFEALLDAGVNPMDVRGKRIGVYIGATVSENDSLMFENVENGFGVTGQARTMIANRISYWLNITGPSYALDNTWLAGLQAIKSACEDIKNDRVESAIVGTCNLAMNSRPSYLFKQLGVTSKDGITRVFDDNGDGYARSEGIVVFYLQRSNFAKRKYATIINCNASFNGSRIGPPSDINVDCLSKFMTDFYKEAQVNPKEVQYVETYGCGIKILDEKELEAIDSVFNQNREEPLLIGSVKSNLGHAEASGFMLSIVKVIIALETGIIPGNLNYETPNKHIPSLINNRMQVVSGNTNWTPALAAVNGFGLTSAFGQILLKPNDRIKNEIQLDIPMLNILSTRTEEGMKEIIEDIKTNPVIDPEYSRLIHDVFATTIPGHLYRGYVLHGDNITDKTLHFTGSKRPIWFVYSGMGSQWQAMGKDLLKFPIFAQSIERCHKVLETKKLNLKQIITDNDPHIFDNILHSFVGIAAIQVGLTDLLTAIGIVSDGIIGHSVGELGCAYADGCLTAEQVVLSAYYRGRASQEVELIPGIMAAIGIGAKKMKGQCPASIDIACHNGPESCTLSGPKEEMQVLVAKLQDQNIFARLVNVSNIAYHSRYIKPAAPLLLKYLKDIISKPIDRSKKWISTSIVESAWGTDLAKTVSAEYLTNNLLSSVCFEEGSKHIPKNSVVIEIAPHGLLQAILKKSLSVDCTNVPLTKRDADNGLQFLCGALGQLYINGVDMDISALYPHVEYPVSRGTRSLSTLVRWMHDEQWRTGLQEFQDYSNSEQSYAVNLNFDEFRNLVGHRIRHDIVIPISTYLPLVCNILSNTKRVDCILFEDIIVKRHIVIPEKDFVPPIRIMVQRGTGNFEISDRYGVIILGRISVPETDANEEICPPPINTEDLCYSFSKSDLQKEFNYRNYQFNGVFNNVDHLNIYNEGSTAHIGWQNDWPSFLNSMIQVNMFHAGEFHNIPILPTYIKRILINLDQLQEHPTDIGISYHYKTNILTSSIAQVKDVQFSPYIQEDKPLRIETSHFIKYDEDSHDIQTEINMCLQIVQQSLKSENSLYIITEIKDNESNSLENYIYYYSDHHFESKIQLNMFNSLINNIPGSSLTVISSRQLQNIHLLFKQTDFILVGLPIAQQLSLDSTICVIRSFYIDEVQYHLLKKMHHHVPVIINIKSKCLTGSHLQNTSLPWAKQLHLSLKAADLNQKRIYLVSTTLPENGIDLFLQDVKSLEDSSNIRLVFLLDEALPECQIGAEFYQEMFRKDLQVTVYKNGNWGSYFKTPFTKQDNENQTNLSSHDLKNMFHNYDVKCLGLNVDRIHQNEELETTDLGPVNFSGYDTAGKPVMGIARTNLESRQLVPDPVFVWPIPDHWTAVQAATVPHVYACAYYVLFELAGVEPGETILVHNGCNSFGQAVIQIAFRHYCKVYTTVGSNLQRAILLNNMKMLSPNQILSYTDTRFKQQILQKTDGHGVNVIINTLSGEALQASMRCISALGRIIHVDISDSDVTNTIGMNLFLVCTAMYGFESKNLLDKPHDIKTKIHAMVSDGIQKYFIKPLRMTVVGDPNLDRVLRYLNSDIVTGTAVLPIDDRRPETPLNYKSTTFANFVCNKDESYIVCGDDPGMLISTMHWLGLNGAKYITVFTNNKSNCTSMTRHINSLKLQYNTIIKLLVYGINEVPSTRILQEIHEQKKIGVVLILNKPLLADTLKYVKHFDAQLTTIQSTAHLICFWGNQMNMTYKRADLLPVSNVKWAKNHEFASVVRVLGDILDQPAEIVVRNDELSDDCSNNFTLKNFYVLLSNSQDSMISISDSASSETELIHLRTNGSPDVKELPPSFIVPGLLGQKCKYFKSLLRNLICPIYMVNNGSSDSLESIATAAVKQIKQKTTGLYNIIGISFGGALALEIVKLLEEDGEQTQLYLIDGVPETIQNLMNENDKIEWLETSLLCSLLRINGTESISSLRRASNWDLRVENALQLGNYTKKEFRKITEGLQIVKNKLNQVLNYKPSGKTITGTTRLVRPQDSSQDYSYSLTSCCTQVKVEIIKGNHFTILETDQLATHINDTLIVPKLYH